MTETIVTARTPADVLRAAADLIERDGWRQGASKKGSAQRCALVALFDVYSHDVRLNSRTGRLLADRIGAYNVVFWNDRRGQTAENVIATMRSVADDLDAP